jgi:hypothetical protein
MSYCGGGHCRVTTVDDSGRGHGNTMTVNDCIGCKTVNDCVIVIRDSDSTGIVSHVSGTVAISRD